MRDVQTERRLQAIEDTLRQVMQPASKRQFIAGLAVESQKLFGTPSGGIPAASGSPPGAVTVPAALCTEYDWQTSGTFQAVPTANSALVYNITDQTIAPNVLIKASKVMGYWVVDTASCGANGQGFQNWT